MYLVVDANIVLSGLVKASFTRALLLDSRLKLFAPNFLLTEVENHVFNDPEIHAKLGLSHNEKKELVFSLTKQIRLYPSSSEEEKIFEGTLVEALALAAHPEDSPYLALATILNCPVWTNDKDFTRQGKIRVVATKEVIEELESKIDGEGD